MIKLEAGHLLQKIAEIYLAKSANSLEYLRER
jgi:hypothetical protein